MVVLTRLTVFNINRGFPMSIANLAKGAVAVVIGMIVYDKYIRGKV